MGIRMDASDSLTRLTEIQHNTLFACLKYGEAAANKMVKHARTHFRWEEHTRNAKNGLNGGASWHGKRVRVELAHGVHYGVYLEKVRFRHKGNLAIVFPTVQKMAPEIIEGWAKVVRKGGKIDHA